MGLHLGSYLLKFQRLHVWAESCCQGAVSTCVCQHCAGKLTGQCICKYQVARLNFFFPISLFKQLPEMPSATKGWCRMSGHASRFWGSLVSKPFRKLWNRDTSNKQRHIFFIIWQINLATLGSTARQLSVLPRITVKSPSILQPPFQSLLSFRSSDLIQMCRQLHRMAAKIQRHVLGNPQSQKNFPRMKTGW